MDQVILDSKTWNFQVLINLIQIKMFEKLGPGVKINPLFDPKSSKVISDRI